LYVALESGAFARHGLDVELTNLGSSLASQAALMSGDVLAAGLGGGATITAMLAGADLGIVAVIFDTVPYQVLSTPEVATIAYPLDVLAVNRGWLRADRDQVRRVLESVVEGARLFKSDRELGLRALERWLKLDDRALLEDTYAYFTRAMPDHLLPREEGLRLIIDEVAADKPEARALQPADLVDSSLVAEIR